MRSPTLKFLARDRLVAAHDAFATAQVDDDVAVFDALDAAVDDLADAILELFVLTLALGLADLMGDDLAGHLGLDAAELERRQDFFVDLADLGVAPGALGDRELDLADLAFQLDVVLDDGRSRASGWSRRSWGRSSRGCRARRRSGCGQPSGARPRWPR
jgi:hypothetical protein